MRSIQSKFILLTLTGILLSALIIGSAGILSAGRVVDKDAARIMNLMCSEQGKAMDSLFDGIEQSVDTMADYAVKQLESAEKLRKDKKYRKEYTKKIEQLFWPIARNTKGAISFYVRYAPELVSGNDGLFYSKDRLDGNFEKTKMTDIPAYDPSDIPHVGWYYIPLQEKKAVWLEPYRNGIIDVCIISYVVPLYKEGHTIGILGMDIGFEAVTEKVDEMKVYDSGFAFLTNEKGTVMYDQDIDAAVSIEEENERQKFMPELMKKDSSGDEIFSYTYRGEKKKMAFQSLENGMRLVLTVPEAEINSEKNKLLGRIGIETTVISLFFVFITGMFTKKLVKPLKGLTEAAGKIADGDMNIKLLARTKDEVGILTESFQKTVEHLRKYMDEINGLAYHDALTGVGNKTAYQEAAGRIERNMNGEHRNFALIVLDINGLKNINDTYGHDAGDLLIKNAADMIRNVFSQSQVFRIGGDEFVVFLEDEEMQKKEELMEKLEDAMRPENQKCGEAGECVSIAKGIAVYDPEHDRNFLQVFKRADKAMYENKIKMKKQSGELPR